ncbi:MAG TPA: PDZ domain-containing protein, partial [Candidatus Udaeobacter sp.]|nr:PDZ domain-containing protein [Candidatus Udaeobacter sp.]
MRSHDSRAAWRALALSLVLGAVLAVPARVQAESSNPESHRGWLGVSTQTLDGDLREGLDYKGDGVLVNSVMDGSPAERAGLHQGDVIIQFDGRDVDSPERLRELVRGTHSGERVRLEVARGSRRETLSVTLGELPGEMDRRVVIRTRNDDKNG